MPQQIVTGVSARYQYHYHGVCVCACVWQNFCHYIAVIVTIQFVTPSSKSLQQLQTMNGTQKHFDHHFPSDWFARFGHVIRVG